MKVVDITMPIGVDYKMHTPVGVKNVGLQLEVIKDYDAPGGAGQFVQAIYTRLHSGCHIDAPAHMTKGGANIIDFPADYFVGPAVMADMTAKNPGGAITDKDLEEAVGGLVSDSKVAGNCRLLIRTDWNDNYGKENYESDSPYMTLEALQWCIDKGFKIVGMDFAHVRDDERATKRYITSRKLLENGVLTLSRLHHLGDISEKIFILSCLPLAIRDCEASMTRAVAIEGLL